MYNSVYVVFGIAVFMASTAQAVLKYAAMQTYACWWKSYLNLYVIGAYGLFFLFYANGNLVVPHSSFVYGSYFGCDGLFLRCIVWTIIFLRTLDEKKLNGAWADCGWN